MRMPAALLLLFCAGPAAAGGTAPALVALRGNVLFDELVYRSTLDLPGSARATPTEALAVSAKLLGFVRRAGYDLATVRAKVEGEHIAVDIDEGRLDKIIVFGEGIMETFRFKLELSMPAGVFNRPALERQLRVLADRYRLRHYSYQLVPAAVQENQRQIDEVELPGIRPGLRYELHILIATSPWASGAQPLSAATPRAQTRPYAEAIAKVGFNPGERRTDRKSLLDFEARAYSGSASSDKALWLRAAYQRRFPLGWHELWWQVRRTLRAGGVLFPDEESIGSHLHGPFGGSDFARKLASTGLEFRYSLLRDVIKLGFFYDQVFFGAIDRTADVASLKS